MSLPSLIELEAGRNVQLDSREVNPSLGEVNITRTADCLKVSATVLMKPGVGTELWQTGVAIDCSYSMERNFGGSHYNFVREMTANEVDVYCQRGIMQRFERDGKYMCTLLNDAEAQLIKDGILRLDIYPNEVEKISRKVIPMLAKDLDADGGCTVIYWALGADGSEYEVLGDLTAETAAIASYSGVATEKMGLGTRLMPAINYFLETFKDARMGFFVFVTDGRIDDFEEVKALTCKLSRDIAAGRRNMVKMVLIGLGQEIDHRQMEELDDLPDTHDLPVDIWDHKIAVEMRSLLDIFAELVDENKMVAPSGEVQDDTGRCVHRYSDGLPALMNFELPLTAKGFRIVLPNGMALEQPLLRA